MKDIKEQLAKYKRIERKYDEYIKSVEKANIEEARKEEHEETINDTINKLTSYGMPKEEISKALGISLQ